ncbi:17beta-estradiol 17-dehydrogenase / very-long-chain 3-oxoacyl-CoA reductase [Chryseobacterium ginsenosidimutans]|uniref:SDR family NAD(P)-dependent oxidoreductase n=1 Tax=Chryseobacterium ginsenosidimutans TaxID=687846 RepID=UPI002780A70F|nr:SDR family NAD(P)-dependent oxidoreductase [Chryseobacterium ginsenosidimutans]MDQ0595043.1 17beta-estradiol 17-dehydrogenase / very-long-chain 3-oxoacyl-CoA reductase [Chryseobacterium ginsenosidimutans]
MLNHFVFIVGICFCTWVLYRLINFIYPYAKPSTLKKYLHLNAYAIVIGATDGIGKAIAIELAGRGFNIVLHGRNADKLNSVENEIKTINTACTVISLLHDGSKNSTLDISPIKDLPITILVNNVGVGPINKLTDFTNSEIEETITLNTIFPSQLTRNLLSHLNNNSLILNVSSYAGLFPPPYLAVYAGTKAYNNAFSISLARELDDKEVISLITGSVNTGTNKKPVTFMRPSASNYAKNVLNIVGCGRKSIMPYWPHAIQTYITSLFPEFLIDSLTKNAIKKEL